MSLLSLLNFQENDKNLVSLLQFTAWKCMSPHTHKNHLIKMKFDITWKHADYYSKLHKNIICMRRSRHTKAKGRTCVWYISICFCAHAVLLDHTVDKLTGKICECLKVSKLITLIVLKSFFFFRMTKVKCSKSHTIYYPYLSFFECRSKKHF